jgi:glycosyltransferase involved in cell wall biosynthesis
MKKRNVRFDLIHIHSALDAGIIYYLSGIKMKCVITEHYSAYAQKEIPFFKQKYLHRVFSMADCVIAVGNGLKNDISIYTTKQVSVIFNLVSMTSFLPISSQIKKNKFIFFSLGLSVNVKGFDILVDAFSRSSIQTHCELYIAGLNPEEMEILQNLIDIKRLTGTIKLLGILTREEVAHYLYNCDCFAMPSRFETFGVVFAEAMYFGKPVIASKTGGPDSYITPETGILVPVEDVIETVKALEYMFYNIKKFDPSLIKNHAEQNFSKEVIVKKIIEKYNEVVSIE